MAGQQLDILCVVRETSTRSFVGLDARERDFLHLRYGRHRLDHTGTVRASGTEAGNDFLDVRWLVLELEPEVVDAISKGSPRMRYGSIHSISLLTGWMLSFERKSLNDVVRSHQCVGFSIVLVSCILGGFAWMASFASIVYTDLLSMA